jgi:lipid II:glycine glycyltransferase (peptidoglycan interpeptide bridge formation enzyme)
MHWVGFLARCMIGKIKHTKGLKMTNIEETSTNNTRENTETSTKKHPKLEQIEQKIKQLKAQKAAIDAKSSKLERAKKTRQKIVIGAWIIANEPQKVIQIVASLTREQDRKAFV